MRTPTGKRLITSVTVYLVFLTCEDVRFPDARSNSLTVREAQRGYSKDELGAYGTLDT